ncbi:hypothetical protein A3744_23040 [Oleiphilus sp. HI0073]|jgi:hypothetical protein|nr:hypothetical protein A3737_24665 [Oleiphilus sp. HI0065]KZY89609.1 hypothetical protein A3744_23040 [Oleiphilus sp. HI0073]
MVTDPQPLAAGASASADAVFSVESPQAVSKANADNAATNGFFMGGFLYFMLVFCEFFGLLVRYFNDALSTKHF